MTRLDVAESPFNGGDRLKEQAMYDVTKLLAFELDEPVSYKGVDLLPGDAVIYDTCSEDIIRLVLNVRPAECGSAQQPTCTEAKKGAEEATHV